MRISDWSSDVCSSDLIECLSRRRRLIVADLPGHGQSALPETPDHEGISRALARGLEDILGADNLPADLCGFSFGGVALAHLAALYPHVARRLVIVGCGGDGPGSEERRVGERWVSTCRSRGWAF